MRILVMAAGSHGDVAPYTGLGARLRDAGHEVALAAPETFRELVGGSGLEFRPLPVDPRGAPSERKEGRSALLARAAAFIDRLGDGLADAAAPGADLLLLATTTAPLGWHLVEAMDVPSLGVYLQPTLPTREFPPVVGPARSLGRFGNRVAGAFGQRVVDRLHTGAARRLRARLGLPGCSPTARRRAQERANWPVLHGFSPTLVPRPADWREGLRVVGNWWPHVAADYRLSAEVEDFLRAGPPPLFIGFGSMAAGQGERLGALVVDALGRAGVRGVLQSGWAGIAADGDDVLTVGEIPHSHLFPRMAAVVHHAGAGTAAAVLRAGVPSVPVPVTADQPFWAGRLTRLGAATRPIPFAELTAARLADAIRQAVEGGALRGRAEAASRAMAEEDGAARVVDAVAALEDGRQLVSFTGPSRPGDA
ncbi:glycosyltransferase family 1 protein [Streptomyces kaniharaensis]|uniref:Glycosyltransferase family 1 protein n=1 Tax=Streptomyces kaniharaensis TaxID=212423 RepID=A0A6N7KWL9_9ACTN|nr:glycosyltransferase [Streptomyces kaniharaensis]MQS15841.1 glycosyltransferase family 1 protein [Streptomyces kaniharaensis]